MSFYGVEPEDIEALVTHLAAVCELYNKRGRPSFVGDNLLAVMRNMSFIYDKPFFQTFNQFAEEDGEKQAKVWRLHTYCWAGKQCLPVPGDFVECGVYRGFYSAIMAKYLSFGSVDKEFYLYDTFAGLPEEWSLPREREQVNDQYDWDGVLDLVNARFADYPNIHVIHGTVPDVLHGRAPERIAFLHLDLNAAAAELAALDVLYDRISDGAIILLDDFGRFEQREICAEHVNWWSKRGQMVLELPTGQGMVIKRGDG